MEERTNDQVKAMELEGVASCQVAKYIVSQVIDHDQAFNWWV